MKNCLVFRRQPFHPLSVVSGYSSKLIHIGYPVGLIDDPCLDIRQMQAEIMCGSHAINAVVGE